MMQMGANNDGTVALGEFLSKVGSAAQHAHRAKQVRAKFAEADVDGDGTLDLTEVPAFRQGIADFTHLAKQARAKLDDEEGSQSEDAEIAAKGIKSVMMQMGANNDGKAALGEILSTVGSAALHA